MYIDQFDLGSALCCFEESSLPSHQGTRTMVMRVKKVTSPIETTIPDYDGWVLKPQEGQLVGMHRTSSEPWSLDIDKQGMTDLGGWFSGGK